MTTRPLLPSLRPHLGIDQLVVVVVDDTVEGEQVLGRLPQAAIAITVARPVAIPEATTAAEAAEQPHRHDGTSRNSYTLCLSLLLLLLDSVVVKW